MNPYFQTYTVQVEGEQHTIYLDNETYMLVNELLTEQQIAYSQIFQ